MRATWIALVGLTLALIIAGILFWRHQRELKISRIESTLHDMCFVASDKGTDIEATLRGQQACEYGTRSKAEDLADGSAVKMLDELQKFCIDKNAISRTTRIAQQMDALDGKAKTDADICREQISATFPDL